MEELYRTLGEAKCQELRKKELTLWQILELSKEGRKSTQVGGAVLEGIARDFIREFLPAGFGIKSGLVFDTQAKKMSPQIDGIIYSGVPLLEFTDVVVVEQEQVKAIVEIKSWIDTTAIFGDLINRETGNRDPYTELFKTFQKRKVFIPPNGKFILFAFNLNSGSSDAEVIERLKEVCDFYAIVTREKRKIDRERDKETWDYNFDNSVSRLIKWLRNLS